MATVAELEQTVQDLGETIKVQGNRLDRMLQRLEGIEEQAPGEMKQCTADFPHQEMNYSEGRYHCRCGMRYSKDGHGGLRLEG